MKTDKYTITEYTLRDLKITKVQSFKKSEADALQLATDSTADYVIVNDLDNKQIFTKGEMPVLEHVEAAPIHEPEIVEVEPTTDENPAV